MTVDVVRKRLQKLAQRTHSTWSGRKEIPEDARREEQRYHKNSLKGRWETVEIGMEEEYRIKKGNWKWGKMLRRISLKSKSSSRDSAFVQKLCLWKSEAEHLRARWGQESFLRPVTVPICSSKPPSIAQQTAILSSLKTLICYCPVYGAIYPFQGDTAGSFCTPQRRCQRDPSGRGFATTTHCTVLISQWPWSYYSSKDVKKVKFLSLPPP